MQPDDRGWLWCETLELWLGTWEGSIRREPPAGTCSWLRFYDAQGNLMLLPEEQVQQERLRAEQAEAQLAQERDRLRERLRASGIDPDEVLDEP